MGKKPIDTDMDDLDSFDDWDSDDFNLDDDGFGSNARQPAKGPAHYGLRFGKKLPEAFGKKLMGKISDEMPNTTKMVEDAFDVKDSLMDLKDTVAEQASFIVNDTKKAIKPFLPFVKKILPSSIYKKADAFLTVEKEQRYNAEKEKELRRNSEMGEAIASLFSNQNKIQAAAAQEERVNRTVTQMRGEQQHRASLASTQEIKHELQLQNAFMNSSVLAYMKKSLELKYKAFFVSQDLLEVAKVQAKLFDNELPKIVKNTALPDIQKTLNTEFLWNRTKERMLTAGQDKIRDFLAKGVEKAKKKLLGTTGDIRSLLQQISGAGDMIDESMMGNDAFDVIGMASDGGAGMLGNMLATPMAKNFLKIFGTEIADLEESSGNYKQRLYARMKSMKDKYSSDPSFMKGMVGQLLDFFVQDTNQTVSFDKTELYKSPFKPTSFDISTRHTIVEIIPGLMTKQLKYLMDIANGKDNEELAYDYKLGNFDTSSNVLGRAVKDTFHDSNEAGRSATALGKMRGRFMLHAPGNDPKAFDAQVNSIRQMMDTRAKFDMEFLPEEFIAFVKNPDKPSPYIKKITQGLADPLAAASVIVNMIAPNGEIDKKAVRNMNSWFYEGTNQDYLNKMRMALAVPGMSRLFDDHGLIQDRGKFTSEVSKDWMDEQLNNNRLKGDEEKRAMLYGQSSFFKDFSDYEDKRLLQGTMEDHALYKTMREGKRIFNNAKKREFDIFANQEDPNAQWSMGAFQNLALALKNGNLKDMADDLRLGSERELSGIESIISESSKAKEAKRKGYTPIRRSINTTGTSDAPDRTVAGMEVFQQIYSAELEGNKLLGQIRDGLGSGKRGKRKPDVSPKEFAHKELVEEIRNTLGMHTTKSAEDRANMISLLHEISLFNYHQGDRFLAPGIIRRSAKRLFTFPFKAAGWGLKGATWGAKHLGAPMLALAKLPFKGAFEILKRTGPIFNTAWGGVKGAFRGAGHLWENVGKPLGSLLATSMGGLYGFAKDNLPGFAKGVFDFAKSPFKKLWEKKGWLKDKYTSAKKKIFGEDFVDIYRRDKQDKILLSADKQASGIMFQDGSKVKKSADINQPVFASDDEKRETPLISKEDLEVGLVGSDGKPIGIKNKALDKLKSPFRGIKNLAKKLGFNTPINEFLMKGLGGIGKGMSALFGGVTNPFSSTVPNFQGRVLTRLNMLIQLGGGTPPEDGPLVGTSIAGKIGSGLKAGAGAAGKAATWAFGKLKAAKNKLMGTSETGSWDGFGMFDKAGAAGSWLKDKLGAGKNWLKGKMGFGSSGGASTMEEIRKILNEPDLKSGKSVAGIFSKVAKGRKFIPKTIDEATAATSATLDKIYGLFARRGKKKKEKGGSAVPGDGIDAVDAGIMSTVAKYAIPVGAAAVTTAAVGLTGKWYIQKNYGSSKLGIKLLELRKEKYGLRVNGKTNGLGFADVMSGGSTDWLIELEKKVKDEVQAGRPHGMTEMEKLHFLRRLDWDVTDKEACNHFSTWLSARFVPVFRSYLNILQGNRVDYFDMNNAGEDDAVAQNVLKLTKDIPVSNPKLVMDDWGTRKFKKARKTWIDPVTGKVMSGEEPDPAILDARRQEMEDKKADATTPDSEKGFFSKYNPYSMIKNKIQRWGANSILDDAEYDSQYKFTGDEQQLLERTKAWIKGHEGLRLRAYMDGKGNNTIGYGHLNAEGYTQITKAEAEKIFDRDMDRHLMEASKIPEWGKLDAVRRMALLNMVFNMGRGGVMNFVKMRKALAEGNYPEAGAEALKSDYANDTGNRSGEVAALLKTGDPKYMKPKAISIAKEDKASLSAGEIDELSNKRFVGDPNPVNPMTGAKSSDLKADGASIPMGAVGDQPSGEGDNWKKEKPTVNVDGVNPAMRNNFEAMADDYKDRTGKPLLVTSAYRDPAQQAALYAKDPSKAAPPGKSYHNKGLAMDINSPDANYLDQQGLLDKYGFTRPLLGMKEPWHIEPKGLRDKGAKVLASDSPNPKSVAMPKVGPRVDYQASLPGNTVGENFVAGMKEGLKTPPVKSVDASQPIKVSVDNKDVVDETVRTNQLLAEMLKVMNKNMTGALMTPTTQAAALAQAGAQRGSVRSTATPTVAAIEPVLSTRRVS